MRSTRPLLVVALVLASALTSACASIPTSGKVEVTDATPASAQDPQIRVLARPPRAGATPTEIVTGFLAASASFDDDHNVARSYLTTSASNGWQPDVGVSIYESDLGYRLTDQLEPGTVRMLAFKKAGSLDARGSFAQPAGAAQLRVDFGMSKVGGQWRINTLRNGLILSTGDVTRAYRALNTFYLDVAGGVLVPDPLFLPSQQSTLPLALMRQLLLGPTAWLTPAVTNAIPAGTKLASDSVPVQDGTATVDLAPAPVEATGDDRRQVAAQIAYTLSQVQGVTGVRILVGGEPFAVPGVDSDVIKVSDLASFDPDAPPDDPKTYAIVDGHLNVVEALPIPVSGYFGKANNLTSGAVALSSPLIAGVRPVGSGAQVRMGPPGVADVPLIYSGRRITSLSFDRLNQVWFADRVNGTTSVWVGRSGDKRAFQVEVRGLGNASIEALRVSRDGARVALLVADAPGGPAQLKIGRIQRESNKPIVSGLRRVENALASVDDVAWADDTTLLVIGRRAVGESGQAFTVGIDGDSVAAAASVQSMLTIAACPGRPYLTGTAAGRIWVDRGNGWRNYVPGSVPIYPG